MLTEQKWNLKVVFNRSCCHGNYENVKFYLSIKIFHQYIFHLPSFSSWAATFLLPSFGKWHTHKLSKLCSTTLRTLYCSLVRPLLEYSCETWNRHKQRNINKWEAIQRRATKFILKSNDDYNTRLSLLNLQSLLY